MSISTIPPREVSELLQSGKALNLIDVRTPAEYESVHAQGARLLPLDQLDPKALSPLNGEPLYVICHSGSRARQACERLVAAGLANVVSVEGGTQAWEQAGLPVVRGRKMMSLERQVRIAAGALVFLSALLALLWNTWFALLALVVGGGLVFAGITDTCGTGLLLAKMPWNRASCSRGTCAR